MNTEQVARAFSIASNVAYVLMVCSVLVIMFPGLRRPLAVVAKRALYDYRYGLWLGQQPPRAPVPGWVRLTSAPADALPVELERPE